MHGMVEVTVQLEFVGSHLITLQDQRGGYFPWPDVFIDQSQRDTIRSTPLHWLFCRMTCLTESREW